MLLELYIIDSVYIYILTRSTLLCNGSSAATIAVLQPAFSFWRETFTEMNDPELLQSCIVGNLLYPQFSTALNGGGCSSKGVQREGEGWTRQALKMKIEEINREVVYQCSKRDHGERHPCPTSSERSLNCLQQMET